jgi:hypothetical protein
MLIERVVLPNIAPLANVVGTIRLLCHRQGNNMLISNVWSTRVHRCFQQHRNGTNLLKNYKRSSNQKLHTLEKRAKINGTS